ncbi:MAG: rhomboid family intramembrane serine protease [Candidatus Lokiarchaeota archaeon]|nr:rhomboid family intramembrane serine protease [Candidatus Lokiarchaeota archaeon]MBD3200895.1 rhomboid family intramembrane serine protease [Candidatus Lokiarchaeota archaeon]
MFILDAEDFRNSRLTLSLIFLNILFYITFNLSFPDDYLLALVQINSRIIQDFELWRLITAMFLHSDILHLFSNLLALLIFGAFIESNKNFNKIQFLIIYIISGLIGNLFSLVLLPINSISLGASGAIFGLIGAAFLVIITQARPLLIFAIAYILYFLVGSFSPGINLWAHLFGLMGGILLGYLLTYEKLLERHTYYE